MTRQMQLHAAGWGGRAGGSGVKGAACWAGQRPCPLTTCPFSPPLTRPRRLAAGGRVLPPAFVGVHGCAARCVRHTWRPQHAARRAAAARAWHCLRRPASAATAPRCPPTPATPAPAARRPPRQASTSRPTCRSGSPASWARSASWAHCTRSTAWPSPCACWTRACTGGGGVRAGGCWQPGHQGEAPLHASGAAAAVASAVPTALAPRGPAAPLAAAPWRACARCGAWPC